MIKYENQCVDCGLPCIYEACRYYNVPIHYCDQCGRDGAEYEVDGEELCEDCAEKYLKKLFDCLTLSEKANLLDVDLSASII